MADALHQHLMRAHGIHHIVNTFGAAVRLAFNTVKGRRMHHGHDRSTAMLVRRERGDYLRLVGRARTERTIAILLIIALLLVAYDDPGARDGVLAEFHGYLKSTMKIQGRNQTTIHHGDTERIKDRVSPVIG